jgi:RHS repeat-associated protein
MAEVCYHLGNVLNVITDRKLPVDIPLTANSTLGDGVVDYFTADVVSYSDYLPFGQIMPNRHGYTGTKYRFGFQDQEIDDELKGEDNSVNFTYRMSDPRLGRFFAVDPLTKTYPYLTPYQFASNSPIYLVEVEGLEGTVYVYKRVGDQEVFLKKYTVDGLKSDIKKVAVKDVNSKTVKMEYSLVVPPNVTPTVVTRNLKKGEKPMGTKELNQTFGNNLSWQDDNKIKESKNEGKGGQFTEFSMGGAVGGGISLSFGVVSDSDGDSKFYFTFTGNCGIGGGYALNTGKVTPTTNRNFQVEDWAGNGNSASATVAVGPVSVGGTHGGTEADGTVKNKADTPITGFSNMGQSSNGYTTNSSTSSKTQGLKVEVMISKSKTITF